jgi:hypothetical protein
MTKEFKMTELLAWQDYLVGKPCPFHPKSKIRNATYGLWCGNKNEWGTGCNGGNPTEEFLTNLRKEKNV